MNTDKFVTLHYSNKYLAILKDAIASYEAVSYKWWEDLYVASRDHQIAVCRARIISAQSNAIGFSSR